MSWIIGVLAMAATVWILLQTWDPLFVSESPVSSNRALTTSSAGVVNAAAEPVADVVSGGGVERPATHGTIGTVGDPLEIDGNNVDQLGRSIGSVVVIVGTVDQIIDEVAFVLQPSPNGANEGVGIIINPNQLPLVRNASRVHVQGIVRRFDPHDLEATYGVDVSQASFDDWRGRPVIVATDVASEPE